MQEYAILYKKHKKTQENTRQYSNTQQYIQQCTIICKIIQCHTIFYKNFHNTMPEYTCFRVYAFF